MLVDTDAYSENWTRIFNGGHPNCGTPECCGECEDGKDTKTETDENMDEVTESIHEGQDGQGC